MNTEELKKLAMAATPGPWMYLLGDRFVYDRLNDGCRGNPIVGVDCAWAGNRNNLNYVAAANPATILALIAEIERFTQDAEMAAASLNLLTGHHEHLLAEFDRVTKERDELLAAWKEYQNADFGVSCQRGVVGKCMCAKCTNDRASAVFASDAGQMRKERDEAIAKLDSAQAEIRALESKLLDREVQS